MDRVKEKVRQFDIFGAPISFTYKGDHEFKTGFGGCISLVIWILLVSSALESLYFCIFDPTYAQVISQSYTTYDAPDQGVVLDTKNQTLAAAMIWAAYASDSTKELDIRAYFRVQYFIQEQTYDESSGEATTTNTWINSTLCSDYYATQMQTDSTI